MTTIALLNIGSELLRGRTINTNAATIAKILGSAGYRLETTLVIHDDAATIRDSIVGLLAHHDVVLMTGGLGPTKDDITKNCLLELFGGEMILHEETLMHIRRFLESRKRPLIEENRSQAMVPSSAQVLFNRSGTAPAMVFRTDGKYVVSMPGVPFEMTNLMQEQVLPLIREAFPGQAFLKRIVRTAGVPESRIAEKMTTIEADIAPGIDIAYLPGYDGTKIELQMRGPHEQLTEMEAKITEGQRMVADLFHKYTYALEDLLPHQLLARHLLAEQISFATAESCTGGGIAAALVQNSGISAVLKGSVVAYMESVKEAILGVKRSTIDTDGVVSQAVAMEMASGARSALGSDAAVSITGIAEAPRGAPPEEMPQAWIGFSNSDGTVARHVYLHPYGGREVNIRIATNAALIYALKQLQKQ